MAQSRQEIPGNSRSLLHHIPSRNHRPNHSDGASIVDSFQFRIFCIVGITIGCILIGIQFAEIHTAATTLHSLVVHNQLVNEGCKRVK
jgi:hypothetical protein